MIGKIQGSRMLTEAEKPAPRKTQFTIQLKAPYADVLRRHAERRRRHPKEMLNDIIKKVLGEDLVDAVVDDQLETKQ